MLELEEKENIKGGGVFVLQEHKTGEYPFFLCLFNIHCNKIYIVNFYYYHSSFTFNEKFTKIVKIGVCVKRELAKMQPAKQFCFVLMILDARLL